MSGYTPVFGTVFTGTLHGRWPDTGLWLCLLAMQNKHGEIDCTPQYISSVTGLPVEDVSACISRFMEADEHSRSDAEGGRRLVPLDPKRPWGWRVVNHSLYRDKARKQFHNQQATDSGANKSRMRTRRDQTRPDATGYDRLSYANANADSNTEKKKPRERALRASRVPAEFVPDLDFARSQISDVDAEREAQKFRDWEFKTPRSDWAAAWRNWIGRCRETGQYAKKGNGRGEWL